MLISAKKVNEIRTKKKLNWFDKMMINHIIKRARRHGYEGTEILDTDLITNDMKMVENCLSDKGYFTQYYKDAFISNVCSAYVTVMWN